MQRSSVNPYVALGIPFGATRDSASAAFAAKAKGLRRRPDGTERLQVLTAALNEIDEALRDPDLALDVYRVPADPGALDPRGTGLYDPEPERMPRGPEATTEERQRLVDEAGDEALRALRAEIANAAELPPR
jgi:hypothetical protein